MSLQHPFLFFANNIYTKRTQYQSYKCRSISIERIWNKTNYIVYSVKSIVTYRIVRIEGLDLFAVIYRIQTSWLFLMCVHILTNWNVLICTYFSGIRLSVLSLIFGFHPFAKNICEYTRTVQYRISETFFKPLSPPRRYIGFMQTPNSFLFLFLEYVLHSVLS